MSATNCEAQELRAMLDLDYEEFARLIGVTSRSVRRWERSDVSQKIPGSAGEIIASLRFALGMAADVGDYVSRMAKTGGLASLLLDLLGNRFQHGGFETLGVWRG